MPWVLSRLLERGDSTIESHTMNCWNSIASYMQRRIVSIKAALPKVTGIGCIGRVSIELSQRSNINPQHQSRSC